MQIQPCKYTDIFRRLLGIPQSQSMVCHKYLKLQVNESTIVPGGTSYNGPYGEVPPKKVPFQVYEKVGISLVEVYKRVGKFVISVCKRAKKG